MEPSSSASEGPRLLNVTGITLRSGSFQGMASVIMDERIFPATHAARRTQEMITVSRTTSSASMIAAGLLLSPEMTWRPRSIKPRRSLRSRLRRS